MLCLGAHPKRVGMIGLVLIRYQSNCLMDTNVFQDDCSEFKSWSMSYMLGMRKSYITHTDVFLILHQTFNYMYQQKISPHCEVGTKRSGISKAIFLETPLPKKQTKFLKDFCSKAPTNYHVHTFPLPMP